MKSSRNPRMHGRVGYIISCSEPTSTYRAIEKPGYISQTAIFRGAHGEHTEGEVGWERGNGGIEGNDSRSSLFRLPVQRLPKD